MSETNEGHESLNKDKQDTFDTELKDNDIPVLSKKASEARATNVTDGNHTAISPPASASTPTIPSSHKISRSTKSDIPKPSVQSVFNRAKHEHGVTTDEEANRVGFRPNLGTVSGYGQESSDDVDSSSSSLSIISYIQKPHSETASAQPSSSCPSPSVADHLKKRPLQKRKTIRTAEDRKRAVAQNVDESSTRKKTIRPIPPTATRVGTVRSSESSESSPDIDDVPSVKTKPRVPVRKCPVEQIDVDCEMGHRPYMEDALVALQDITAYLPANSAIKDILQPTAFFGVYDGHGGFQASRYVQKFFHMRLLEELKELNKDAEFDVHTVIKSVYRRIDHDFLNHCNVPSEGIPPLLTKAKSLLYKEKKDRDSKIKRKREKDRKATEKFTAGPYVQKIMSLQRERARDRNNVVNILRNIPTKDGQDIVSIDDLIRNPQNFDKLDEKDARSFRRFIQRFAQTNGEAYENIKKGNIDFKRSVNNPNYKAISLTDTWSDGSLLTSDDNVSELSGVDSDLGEQNLPDEDEYIPEGSGTPPLKAKDDPMCKNPPTPGSTVCVCLIDRQHIYTSWLGDSEAVLFNKGGAVTPLTIPHSPLREDEAERIRKLGGVIVKQSVPGLKKRIGRVQGQLSVSRAIGDAHLKRWVSSDPELLKTKLSGDEEFAVIASDGLWDVLSFKEVYRLISRYITTDRQKSKRQNPANKHPAGHPPSWSRSSSLVNGPELFESAGENTNRPGRVRQKQAAKKTEQHQWAGCARYLIRTALTCGSTDNISVIVIFFKAGLQRVLDKSSTEERPFTSTSRSGTDSNASDSRLRGRESERRGLFSGVGLFNRARIRRVFARNTSLQLGSMSEDEVTSPPDRKTSLRTDESVRKQNQSQDHIPPKKESSKEKLDRQDPNREKKLSKVKSSPREDTMPAIFEADHVVYPIDIESPEEEKNGN